MRIVVYGRPAPQGSKTPKGRTASGKTIMVETSKYLPDWRNAVIMACVNVMNEMGVIDPDIGRPPPLDGPLVGRMVFTVPKPKSAPKTRVTYPIGPPDTSKLLRSTEDACVIAGVIRDDARIVNYTRLAKVYPGEDLEALPSPGCIIIFNQLVTPEPAPAQRIPRLRSAS